MNDPAAGLPQQLLPHMHLVSRNRYPVMNGLPTDTVVEYLVTAPRIVREQQPMHWTFLDGPTDGTTYLTWQPLQHLGTNFASDGYIWADAEQVFTFEARGYTVEMWQHRSGYHPPNENMATHCRRRYRLLPPKVQNPNIPPPDPSLWIVHYCRAAQNDQLPANRIPLTPQAQTILAQRRFLQSQGQLVRKDFMLHDRNNWPTISFPPQMGPQGFAQPPGAPYQPPMVGGRQPQGAFYPPQQAHAAAGTHATPSKPSRSHRQSAGAMAAAAAASDFSLEDEEISAGDMLDLLSPREISKMRYQQHHEWMEEVFASPYAIKQITPVDLGLGRKGELESLTAGFFEAPTGATTGKESKDGAVALQDGKIDPDKAEEFADRVAKKVADMTAEIEKMKRRHARRMEKLGRLSILKEAEQRLQDSASDPLSSGSEVWRLEGRVDIPGEEASSPTDFGTKPAKHKVDDVIKELENSFGKAVVPEPDVACVDKGGLQERVIPEPEPEPEPPVVETNGAEDITMDMSASAALSQFTSLPTTAPGQPTTSAAGGLTAAAPTTTGAPNLNTATAGAPGLTATTSAPPQPALPSLPQLDGDVSMSEPGKEQVPAGGNVDGETGDWIMVNNEAQAAKEGNSGVSKPDIGDATGAGIPTPGSGIQGLTPVNTGNSGLETSNFDDAADFAHMDSAGDALAAYGDHHDDLDLPDLENSAFGDAFHASDNELGHHHDDDEMS